MLTSAALIESVVEGQSLSFLFESTQPLQNVKIRWEIIAKDVLPVVIGTDGDFATDYGQKTFSGSNTDFGIDIATLDNNRAGPNRNFVIKFYQVDENDSSGASDKLIDEFQIKIIEDEDVPERLFNRNGDSNKNVITHADLLKTTANGLAEADTYIILPELYGSLLIRDDFGGNIIRFDGGVEIIAIAEDVTDLRDSFTDVFAPGRPSAEDLVSFGVILSVDDVVTYNSVIYTLSTGATITINSPASEEYRFQTGTDEVLGYVDFRTKIGSPSLIDPFIVDIPSTTPPPPTIPIIPAPVVEAGYYQYDSVANGFRKYNDDGTPEPDGTTFTESNLGTTNNTIKLDELLPAGTKAEVITLHGGDDIYEINANLARDIDILETRDANLIKFLDGTRITSITTEQPGPLSTTEILVIQLGEEDAGAGTKTETATIRLLGGIEHYNFQFGDAAILDEIGELADLPAGVHLDIV
jgi:hypothetical protein